jgi:hypothetical protein
VAVLWRERQDAESGHDLVRRGGHDQLADFARTAVAVKPRYSLSRPSSSCRSATGLRVLRCGRVVLPRGAGCEAPDSMSAVSVLGSPMYQVTSEWADRDGAAGE